MMQIQRRDQEILKLVYEQQFITAEHVEMLFNNESYHAALYRLNLLTESGYLLKLKSQTLGSQKLFQVTKLGACLAREAGSAQISLTNRLYPGHLVHDSLVTKSRIRILKWWKATFISERVLREMNMNPLPDGIFQFESGNRVALELENSDKGRSRFISNLNRWADREEVIFILFVATSQPLFNSIREWLKSAPVHKPMGILLFDDLKLDRPPVASIQGLIPLFERESY